MNLQLVNRTRLQDLFSGCQVQVDHARVPLVIETGTVGDPAAQDLILGTGRRCEPTAAMCYLFRGFEQDQAAVRIEQIDPTARLITNELGVVQFGTRPKQRQPESISSLDRAVTTPRIAAQATEDGDHMPAELRRCRHRRFC